MFDIRKYLPFILCVVLGFLIGFYTRGDQERPRPNRSDSTSTLLSTTSVLSATSKSSEGDPDLVVSQKYTAMINGEKVSVEVAKGTANTTGQPTSPSGSPGAIQGQISQTIDITPLLSKLRPTWEIGVGYNYLDKKHYSCVSLQRNYKPNRALDLTCQIQDKQIKGIMIQHRWLLH